MSYSKRMSGKWIRRSTKFIVFGEGMLLLFLMFQLAAHAWDGEWLIDQNQRSTFTTFSDGVRILFLMSYGILIITCVYDSINKGRVRRDILGDLIVSNEDA